MIFVLLYVLFLVVICAFFFGANLAQRFKEEQENKLLEERRNAKNPPTE